MRGQAAAPAPAPSPWAHAANEGDSVDLPKGTRLRFGAGSQWSECYSQGPFLVSPAALGDPAPGVRKTLQRWVGP